MELGLRSAFWQEEKLCLQKGRDFAVGKRSDIEAAKAPRAGRAGLAGGGTYGAGQRGEFLILGFKFLVGAF